MLEKEEKPQFGPEKIEEGNISPESRAIIEALIKGDEEALREAGGRYVESMSAREVVRLKDLAHDMKIDELLGKIRRKPPISPEVEAKQKAAAEKAYRAKYERDPFVEMLRNAFMGQHEGMERDENFYTNVSRGSVLEIFYRTLSERFPNLGVSINEEAVDIIGRRSENAIEVEVDPPENKSIVGRISGNPILEVLWMYGSYTGGEEKLRLGLELEKRGELPIGISKRALARAYKRDIENLKNVPDVVAELQRKLADLGVQSLTDAEIEGLFEKMIAEELEKK